MEITTEQALDVLRNDYWDDVRGVASDIEQRLKEREFTDSSEVDDAIHETCDGHSRVIYTKEAMLCLLFSSNTDAYKDLGYEEAKDLEWSAMAFWAFKQDVTDAIGIDYSDPDCPQLQPLEE